MMWIESICYDQQVIDSNIKMTKLHSPDYKDIDPETVIYFKFTFLIYRYKLGNERF